MRKFEPIELISKRINIAKDDSDTSMFLHLMYSAEQLVKIVTAGLLSCVEDESARHRYTQEHRLVRADGIGEWSSSLDDILLGPSSQYLCREIKEFQRELLEAKKVGSWQYDAVLLLNKCLQIADEKTEDMLIKVQARNWFSTFARLRNKTRGHGALGMNDFSALCPILEESINLMIENLSILDLPWIYLKRNLNGKYKISKITESSKPFDYLKVDRNFNFVDGVYLHAGEHRYVKLIYSNSELNDFYFPNGGFGKNTFECISYITDDKIYNDISPFLTPVGILPKSQTAGSVGLDVSGNCFTNIPTNPIVYINRKELEDELIGKLMDARHPVITLVGRGGIGKTSLAISVLEQIAKENLFQVIIWLSARDIDLLVEGAKPVKPNVLTINDIAKEFVNLLGIKVQKNGPNEKEIMETELTKSDFGQILFVLDNFETVVNPKEVYSWLNTYIRLPNKILITSRYRDFKGDYPIEVHGMTSKEFNSLIENVSREIGLEKKFLDQKYCQDLYTQSDGHPYVAKILLGERLKQGSSGNIKIVLAGKDDILTALFERTYTYLSPLAKRIFLTISNWRSVIPEIALEAVLMRSQNEPLDVEEAIEELTKSSLVETIKSTNDESYFVSVPLSASIFGKKKLSVDPIKSAIEADTIMLHSFGASTLDDVRFGLKPKVEKLFSEIARKISFGQSQLSNYIPILEFICTKYHDSWLILSSLYEEESRNLDAISAVQKYLESPSSNEKAREGWKKLARLYRGESNWQGEVHALVEYCLVDNIQFSELSNSANAINKLFNEHKSSVDTFEKRITIEKVAKVFESRIINERYTDGDDFSRLAWLFLHLGDDRKAKEIVEEGLSISPENIYCQNLLEKLKQKQNG